MASTSAGQRAAIAASFVVQAGLILAAISLLAGISSSPAAPVSVPKPSAPVAIARPPAPQLGPVIGVTVVAAGQEGRTDYPSPVEPILWVPPAAEAVVTVTLTIPQGADLGSFQIGMTSGAWVGVPDNSAALVVAGTPQPGQHTYTLHLTAADLPAVDGNYLVLTSHDDGDPALTAPLAEFIVGQEP